MQANLDASIKDLCSCIGQTYRIILDNRSPSKVNSIKDVLVQIAEVMQECAQFISHYSETKNFCMWSPLSLIFLVTVHISIGARLGKNILSEKTTTTVTNYNLRLDQLMQELRDRVVLNMHESVQQIWEIRDEVYLDSLVCAGKVGLNQAKKCLDRTRMEILNEIIDWINNSNPTTLHIFWLHGQAGRGKSAIVHSITLHARNLRNLGSCFCFSQVRQHEGLHTKLFPTVARNLANCNLRFRVTLVEAIANDSTMRDTEDIAEQWQ